MSRKLMLLLVAVAALAAPLTLAACGDDDDDDDDATTEAAAEETAGPTEVTLTADDAGGNYTFELSEAPTAETETVVFDNQGAEPHAIVYAKINEGFTVDEAYELEGRQGSAEVLIEDGARPGQSKTLEITGEATPGDYAMLCPIPSPEGVHYELGQLEEFTIE